MTDRDRKIEALMQGYDGDGRPGASVLVFHDGEIVFHKSYGFSDLEQPVRATSSTHYRLASVTKQFTAAAILTLADRGKLSLDDSVRRFLPSLPAYADAITIRHLLTHTGGLPDYEDFMPEGTTKQLKDADVLSIIEKRPAPDFAPGAKYAYSNTGYALLALIVERVSGMTFADFLRENIFRPAGMSTAVAYEEGVSTVPNRAYGYSREDDHWKRTDQSLTSAVLGDGGIYASVDELSHWLRVLDQGKFAQAAVPVVDTTDSKERYGFGWAIGEHRGRRTVGHTGTTLGFRNALVRFPDERLAVVVLTNRNEGTPKDLALAIADLFLH